jgi:small subunit ribosomal protein S3
MGQKVNPVIFRLKIIHNWESFWYCKKMYSEKLYEDAKIRNLIFNKMHNAPISRVLIDRLSNRAIVNIHSSKPGLVIGKNGLQINNVRKIILAIMKHSPIINIVEIKKPEIEAPLIAHSIADQLEKRVSFRKIIKRAISIAVQTGLKGIKVSISGRLNGADIARKESFMEGKIPLHTLRAIISYSKVNAKTIYGLTGVKVWVYKGDK